MLTENNSASRGIRAVVAAALGAPGLNDPIVDQHLAGNDAERDRLARAAAHLTASAQREELARNALVAGIAERAIAETSPGATLNAAVDRLVAQQRRPDQAANLPLDRAKQALPQEIVEQRQRAAVSAHPFSGCSEASLNATIDSKLARSNGGTDAAQSRPDMPGAGPVSNEDGLNAAIDRLIAAGDLGSKR